MKYDQNREAVWNSLFSTKEFIVFNISLQSHTSIYFIAFVKNEKTVLSNNINSNEK